MGSSFIYFNNTSNVEIKIKTDNAVNKEKTALNEALTKTLVSKNDSIFNFKKSIKKNDSVFIIKKKTYEKEIKKLKNEKDSLIRILRNFKQSDLLPIGKGNSK
jgi:hypothetical protein